MTKSPRFDLLDLQLFVAIAERGSLSQAAATMPMALSAASARLRQMEQRLGLVLTRRLSHGMALTEAGAMFLEHARTLCRQAREAQEAVEALGRARRESLTVLTNTTGSSSDLPVLLGRFLKAWPSVDLRLEERPSREVIAALVAGEVELGIVDAHYADSPLLSLPFRSDRLLVVVPEEHGFAEQPSCRFREVLDQPQVMLPPTSSLRGFLDRMAALAQARWRVRAEAPGFASLMSLVAEGVGTAILPAAALARHGRELPVRAVDLAEDWAVRGLTVCLNRPETLSPLARRLAMHLTGLSLPGEGG